VLAFESPTSLVGNRINDGDPERREPATTVTVTCYHLQTLALFLVFFSIVPGGINGWDSNKSTFTSNAGPICQFGQSWVDSKSTSLTALVTYARDSRDIHPFP
jgi:hypothetical protein